ncbi:hypothetical protein HPB50_027444 [Hyalomma asiaticum]|uniref:Uncharacterized protein n=1 Tax=Hyalomma asiaticum TaxID=266040 RepID=A0ACB7TP97_HYAAI|nr:hypothetical protein HPB50_027444 [Hyalomma asiaticum]
MWTDDRKIAYMHVRYRTLFDEEWNLHAHVLFENSIPSEKKSRDNIRKELQCTWLQQRCLGQGYIRHRPGL